MTVKNRLSPLSNTSLWKYYQAGCLLSCMEENSARVVVLNDGENFASCIYSCLSRLRLIFLYICFTFIKVYRGNINTFFYRLIFYFTCTVPDDKIIKSLLYIRNIFIKLISINLILIIAIKNILFIFKVSK